MTLQNIFDIILKYGPAFVYFIPQFYFCLVIKECAKLLFYCTDEEIFWIRGLQSSKYFECVLIDFSETLEYFF